MQNYRAFAAFWIIAVAATASASDRPMIYSVNPVGNGDFVGAHHRSHPLERYDELIWERLTELGGQSARVLASWREIESTKGQWDWHSLDREIELCQKNNVEPVVLIVNIPAWVSPTGEKTHEYPPKEANAEDFNRFITTLAQRYKGKVTYYEFWNEQNGFGWHVDTVEGKQVFNVAHEYVPWLYRCYKAIKAVDPNTQIAMGGLDNVGGHSPIYVRKCYELRKKNYNNEKFWDAIADHPYNKKPEETAERAIEKLDAIRAVAAEYGDVDIPLWITEYGWNAIDHGLEVQARGTRQFLERFAQDDQKSLVIAQQLCIADFEVAHLGYGLCDLNLRPRPAFYEFQKLSRPDVPQVHDLQYRLIADRTLRITGTLEGTFDPTKQVLYVRTIAHRDMPDDMRYHTQARILKDKRFEADIRIDTLVVDAPLLAEIYAIPTDAFKGVNTQPDEHPIAHLPMVCSQAAVGNPNFEMPFRAGVPWGWKVDGQAICRDAGTVNASYVRNLDHGFMWMLFDNAGDYRFNDRVEIPANMTKGQRWLLRCFAKAEKRKPLEGTADIKLTINLLDPDNAANRVTSKPCIVGMDWTEVVTELVAPCDNPILRIEATSDELSGKQGRKATWLLSIDQIEVIPAQPKGNADAKLGYITDIPTEDPQQASIRHRVIAERRKGFPIIVHRGVRDAAPENTLEAYSAAMDLGADGVEIDIRKSKDGVLFLFHDNSLDRMTNATGKIDELTYYDLLKVTPKDVHGTANSESRVPTLIAFLELARRRGMLLHLDIKEPGIDGELVRLFDAFDMWDHVVTINTYNSETIRKHSKYSEIHYAGWVPEPDENGKTDHIRPWIVNAKAAKRMAICKDPRHAAKTLGRSTNALAPIPQDLRAWWQPNGMTE